MMIRVEVRPGLFLRINEKELKKFGVDSIKPQATKKITPQASKKTSKKKAEPEIEEVEEDGVCND